ncbi:hypothetical protein OSCT_1831 [Oscillochloris trichoides DG-6]|uniref:Uncharacterized protein n=1 Tax=Oscillochloris trichoides DG-6 TaxID=765420 RepID=E1IET0_9CHLR|nr:hypothetical protein OSCT_1831 [Oscillochloris trichoides DG-6]
MMKEAIQAIVVQQPIKPFAQIQQSSEIIQRQRDVANITWVMSAVHLPTLDEALHSLPHYISMEVFLFWEEFNERVTSSLFHVYDEKTRTALLDFHDAWDKCLSSGTYYLTESTGKRSVFSISPSDDLESVWSKLETDRDLLATTFASLIQILRINYLEVDLDKTSFLAWHKKLEGDRTYNARVSEQ